LIDTTRHGNGWYCVASKNRESVSYHGLVAAVRMKEVAMSASVREQADDQRIELGTGVNWTPIIAAAGLAFLVLTAVVVLHLVPGTYAAPERGPALAQNTDVSSKEQETASPAPLKMRPHWREAPAQAPTVETVSKPAAPPTPKPKRPIVAAKPAPPPPVVVVEARTPPTAEPAPVPQTVPQPPFKRRQLYSEDELFARLLADSRELDIETGKGTTAKLLTEPKKATPPILELVAQRDDLKGLPMRNVADCKTSDKEAKSMKEMSGVMRSITTNSRSKEDTTSSSDVFHRDYYLVMYMEKAVSKNPQWCEDVGVRMLVQMFQPESYLVRLRVVKLLADNKGKSASAALAQWAVFDLNLDIREAAIKALKERSRLDYQSVLLDALRYPWAPIADHAAEAFVALDDRETVSDLVNMLDKPDPLAPAQNKDKKWVAPELVGRQV
jgi:hypothetical protein